MQRPATSARGNAEITGYGISVRHIGLRPVERAPNQPYDLGRFEIVEEPWPTEEGSSSNPS